MKEENVSAIVVENVVLHLTHDIEKQWRAWGIWEDGEGVTDLQDSPTSTLVCEQVLELRP